MDLGLFIALPLYHIAMKSPNAPFVTSRNSFIPNEIHLPKPQNIFSAFFTLTLLCAQLIETQFSPRQKTDKTGRRKIFKVFLVTRPRTDFVTSPRQPNFEP